MTAWQLGPDRMRLGARLAAAIFTLRTKKNEPVCGLDHCTHYTGTNDQRIIVTQPYGVTAAELQEDLTLFDGACPEVIDASEWGFHYPHEAKLFILKFPFDFQEAMQRHEKTARRMEIEKSFRALETDPAPEYDEDDIYAGAEADN